MRAILVKRVSFDAAHFLPDYEGKCRNVHGHHWLVELGVSGEVDPETGMVMDFANLGRFLKLKVEDRFDHILVNNVIENPTAENIAGRIKASWDVVSSDCDVKFEFVRVWETADSYVEVRDE